MKKSFVVLPSKCASPYFEFDSSALVLLTSHWLIITIVSFASLCLLD